MGDSGDRRRVITVPSAGAGPAIIAAGIVVLVIGLAWLNHADDGSRGGTAAPLAHGELPADQQGDEPIPAAEPASPRSLAPFFDGDDDRAPSGSTSATSMPGTPMTPGPTVAGASTPTAAAGTGGAATSTGSGSGSGSSATTRPGGSTGTSTRPTTTSPSSSQPTNPTTGPTTTQQSTTSSTSPTTIPEETTTTLGQSGSPGLLDVVGGLVGGLVDVLL